MTVFRFGRNAPPRHVWGGTKETAAPKRRNKARNVKLVLLWLLRLPWRSLCDFPVRFERDGPQSWIVLELMPLSSLTDAIFGVAPVDFGFWGHAARLNTGASKSSSSSESSKGFALGNFFGGGFAFVPLRGGLFATSSKRVNESLEPEVLVSFCVGDALQVRSELVFSCAEGRFRDNFFFS